MLLLGSNDFLSQNDKHGKKQEEKKRRGYFDSGNMLKHNAKTMYSMLSFC